MLKNAHRGALPSGRAGPAKCGIAFTSPSKSVCEAKAGFPGIFEHPAKMIGCSSRRIYVCGVADGIQMIILTCRQH
jgi:hypothetical protein